MDTQPASSVPRLRPMGYGEILDETLDLFRSNFGLFIGISGLVLLPAGIASYLTMSSMNLENPPPTLYIVALVSLVLTGVTRAALAIAVSNRYLGRPASILTSYGGVLRRLFGFLLLECLVGLLFFLGSMLCVVPGVLAALWLSFSLETYILEGLPVVQAMKQSKQLVGGTGDRVMDRVFVMNLITVVIVQIIDRIPVALFGVAVHDAHLLSLFTNVWVNLSALVTVPIMMIPNILLYYDVRVRKEGFDLEILAKHMSAISGGKTTES